MDSTNLRTTALARAGAILLSVFVSTMPASAQADIETCATPTLAFGGANGTPVSSSDSVNVPGSLTIGDLFVKVEIDHSWVGDIVLELVSPAGTRVRLQDGDGGNEDNLALIYADTGVPYESQAFDFGCVMQPAPSLGSLADFSGENAQGSWTLEITDVFPTSADGVLVRWCLFFFANTPGSLTPSVVSLNCTATADGASLSWSNPASYAAIDIVVDGISTAQLAGSATSFDLTGMAPGIAAQIDVVGSIPGSAPPCFGSCTVVPLGNPAAPLPRKVVLAIIDGLRYEEGLGDPTRQYIPRMDALAAQGVIIEPFLNDGVTVTSRAIPAILCGSWLAPIIMIDPACGLNNRYSSLPTVHEYFRKQGNRPITDCVYVLGGVSCPWRPSLHPSYGQNYWPLWIGETGGDAANLATAQSVIATLKPHFLTFYLSDVDHEGHGGDFNSYTAAIQYADFAIGELWDSLQADPFYAGQTDLIITNDHGRHWFDFTGHGDDCTGCQTIQLLAVGPSFKSGVVSTVPRTTIDIAPTIGAILGFDAEFADGDVMVELFADIALPTVCEGDGGDQLGCTNCPCMNNAPLGTIGGCLNSAGTSAQITATGDLSASLPAGVTTDLRFTLGGAPPGALCLMLSGAAVAPQNMSNTCFGLNSGVQSIDRDGLRCAVMNLKRHGSRSANVTGDIQDSAGPSRVWGGEAQPNGGIWRQGGFVAGQTRFFQVTYRENAMAGCMRGLNTSQAVEVLFAP